ncbi:MAG: hypothetical protein ACFFA0_08490 [Promethearchaeota archaeon]
MIRSRIKGLVLILIVSIIPLMITLIPEKKVKFDAITENNNPEFVPHVSLPPTTHDWWNDSWDFRVPVSVEAVGGQQDAPVELFINFTQYFEDLNVQDSVLNTSTIRVIEYLSSSNYYEVDCQFDPYSRSYDSQTNAIGDLIWILNGTTPNGQTRDFFVYFNNGTNYEISDPNYAIIRIWHEGFEEYRAGDILRPTDGQDNYHPTYWEIDNSTSARGRSSLRIWGNCWKYSATGNINIGPNTIVTAKMRFDDPTPVREISGLGFDDNYANIPGSGNSYRIRGTQSWGYAGSNKFVNQYYQDNTFFWYTFEVDTEISLSSFNYICYIADDDSVNFLNLYWDDISIWAQQVQTTPNNSLQTTLGDVQPIAFTLKITCKDEDGNAVPNAHIYITNEINPSYNQDHITDENGEWTFSDIEKDALYNITVNYTQNGLSSPETATVFSFEDYPITELNNRVTAYLTLSKFNFDVRDKDNDPIEYGFVLLKDGVDTVGKTVLDNAGTGSITWLNATSYDYEAYFDYDSLPDNSEYRYSDIMIDSSAIVANDVNIATEITKIVFNVTDETAQKVPFTNAKLRFYNETDYDIESEIIANVSVDINGLARFISFSNTELGWGDYTVDIYFGGLEQDFRVIPPGLLEHEYNFTLITQDYVQIEIPLNKEVYNSTISIINYASNALWGDSIFINFNFTARDPITPSPTLVTPNDLSFQIFDAEFTPNSAEIDILSSEIATGVFNYTFNSQDFNLIGGTTYYFKIIGNYKSYVFNDIGYKFINIQAISTDIAYYNYSLSELTDNKISVIYGQSVNITIDYFEAGTSDSISGALITYDWDYGSGVLTDDPMHPNFYYFEFDSSSAPTSAEYIIDIGASLANYSTISDSIIVKILARPTSINGTRALFQFSPNVYIFDTAYYYFEYRDTLLDIPIGDLDVASYNWYRLDEDGNPLSGPGNEGSGNLIQSINNIYLLDFDTELRGVGEYSIFITLQRYNYEVRNAFISLKIKRRPITVDFEATGLSASKTRINVIQGDNINFRITLYDPTNGSQLLSGVNVTLTLSGTAYEFTEITPGVYEYDYSTGGIDAFIAPKTLSGVITIEKENYEVNPLSLSIVVGMIEIFPGFPLFYFILIVGGVAAIAGSLVTYRLIQQARIPTFVKKARKMKSVIKSKKSISESLTYPSKEDYIIKKLGDRWGIIGLSIEDTLGQEKKKMKRTSEEFKKGGDNI